MEQVLELPRTVNKMSLTRKVKDMYSEVALHPEKKYHFEMGRELAERLGYSPTVLNQLPADAINSFAGVGYYFHLANLDMGEKVVDLGSGSGMDSFYASRFVGRSGLVNGFDLTDAQLDKANNFTIGTSFDNVRFRKANIEQLPLPDNYADVVISNGVINLSPDKEQVFKEASRILRPKGRLVIADIVSAVDLPESITCDASLWASCIGGAVVFDKYIDMIESAGMNVVVMEDNPQYEFLSLNAKNAAFKYGIKSVSILAIKK